MAKTFTNRGRSRRGLRYKTRGTRMSGDIDTGLGNTLLMLLMLFIFFGIEVGIAFSLIYLLCNGDDSVAIVPRIYLTRIMALLPVFRKFGFVMKCETVEVFEHIDFCQCRPILTDYGHLMVRTPSRVLHKFGWSVRAQGRGFRYVRTVAMGEMAVNYGAPMLYPLFRAIYLKLTCDCDLGLLPDYDREHYRKQRFYREFGEATISIETRLSFEQAFDIDVETQLRFEKRCRFLVRSRSLVDDRFWNDFMATICV